MKTLSTINSGNARRMMMRSIKDIFSTVTAIEHEISLRYQDYQNWIDENYREMYMSSSGKHEKSKIKKIFKQPIES